MKKIYLISCVKSKLPYPAPAGELYASVWFKAARRFVESQAEADWFILSARYGLLKPERIIESYDESLNRMPVGERRLWAKMTARQIGENIRPRQEIVFLAGGNYREFLLPLLEEKSFTCRAPLARLGIGTQVSWLQKHSVSENLIVKSS